MSSKPQTSVVRSDGLRYAQKSGSPVQLSTTASQMSCFLCGTFRPMPELKTKRLLNQNHKVCADGCKKN